MKRRSQLTLPHCRRRPPRRQPAGARRDMNEHEFARALQRHGFAHAGGLHFFDTKAPQRRYVQAVCRTDPIRVDRRATLAKLIRSRT